MEKTCSQRSSFNPHLGIFSFKPGAPKHKGRSLLAAALAIASATKPQSLDELLVLLRLGRFQIIEELAALVDELDQPAP